MISTISLFRLDRLASGRYYEQLSCCLLSAYYLYSYLLSHYLLDYVKSQDFKNYFRHSLPCP